MTQATQEQLQSAKTASRVLRLAAFDQKNKFLVILSDLLLKNADGILEHNKKDVQEARGVTEAMRKRLELSQKSIQGMSQGLRDMIKLEDPVGLIESKWQGLNGIEISKVRAPIGVIFFVYESRPNVIVDAGGLCVKSGNALLVRGGKEAQHSNDFLLSLIQEALRKSDLPASAVQQIQDRNYEVLAEIVKMDKYLDLVVPRGRAEMINYIKDNARVPVIAHERGVCHAYVDQSADKDKAVKIIINGKVSNPAVCNSLEKVLVHKAAADGILPDLLKELFEHGVEIRGCERMRSFDARCRPAGPEDWDAEYLDLIIAVKIVDSLEEAIAHVEKHSSHLSDTIIAEDSAATDKFLKEISSAVVLSNASTRLVDGGVFGLGAELGISTSSVHMRGPMGLKDLTVTRYVVRGRGQIRE